MKTHIYQAFVNAGYTINSNWSRYTFAGVSRREISAYGFFRNALPAVTNLNTAIFAGGYTSNLPVKRLGYSFVAVINKKSVNGWNVADAVFSKNFFNDKLLLAVYFLN